MPHNFLIIGFEGTGCAVVRELKNKLYAEWRSRGNTGAYPEIDTFHEHYGGVPLESRIATLSVDSNWRELDGQGDLSRDWRAFGETLRLSHGEKVLIHPLGMQGVKPAANAPGVDGEGDAHGRI
jgi:hypothetical protein